ncbi:MAG: hypothetical protein QM680_12245 [Luteolibacter sp.]
MRSSQKAGEDTGAPHPSPLITRHLSMYKQSIIFFGFLLPVLLAAAVIGGLLYAKSEVESSFATKRQAYAGYSMSYNASNQLEKQITEKRPHLARWMENIAKQNESIASVNTRVSEISSKLPSKEFQLTASERNESKSGLATATSQNSSQIRLAFRGTYRSVQKAFLSLETQMPQLQLQELKIDPSQNQASLLNVQVSYTSWEQ